MAMIRGAFHKLFKPSLQEIYNHINNYIKDRTGIEEVELGQPPKKHPEAKFEVIEDTRNPEW